MIKTLALILTSFFVNTLLADTQIPEAHFVGYKECTSCHEVEVKQWQGSHHNKAMQHADETSVLGDFNQSVFENYGLMTTFYKKHTEKGTQFWVQTDGPDGKLQDYPIKYTFGLYPLQQYLIEFPGGRLQALDIAWDSRSKEQGGQRWYHLHPNEKITSDDVLHWTGPNMNWNYMCAFCHSTNLDKNYNSDADAYKTSWSEINVSCEACHGPASQHLLWAEKSQKNNNSAKQPFNDQFKTMGLPHRLDERENIQWSIEQEKHKPVRSQAKTTNKEIETCARCHSRRSQLDNDAIHQPFMDNFRPARLISSLYFADGQPKDEVYVYGSFIQSKMHQAGVTCSDCHNPHTNELKLPGDQVCNQCHLPDIYRSEGHHRHKIAVTCIDCHMPATTFMGIDERNDHSFRVPRPDLSIDTEIPNACNQCHTVNTPQWSAQHLKEWYKKQPLGQQQFSPALSAHHEQSAMAESKLFDLINDKNQPAIARATALSELVNYPDPQSLKIIRTQLKDSDPMIRLSALEALSSFDKRSQVSLAFPLIDDESQSIRMEAARLLASIPQGQLSDKSKLKLQRAKQEYVNAQLFNAERPESQVNLGNYYYDIKDFKKSEAAYQQAIKLQPRFIPAYLGLSQLFSQTKREAESELILKKGLKLSPDNPELHHSLGLSYIRQKKLAEALIELQAAAKNAENNIRYHYVYAVALNSSGQTEQALAVLNKVYEKHPNNTEILIALITFNRDAGHYKKALFFARQLEKIMPGNPDIKNLIRSLSKTD